MCFSCQNTPISMPNMNIDRTIKKLVIFGGARELKMGVVSFNNFPSTFLLRTFFWCYSILKTNNQLRNWFATSQFQVYPLITRIINVYPEVQLLGCLDFRYNLKTSDIYTKNQLKLVARTVTDFFIRRSHQISSDY